MINLNSVRLLPTCALGVMMLAGGSNFASAAGEVAAIGVVDDVRNEAFGTIPGSQPARLVLDRPLHRDEHVKTGNDALLRVVFADSTTLLLGANSEMNLDRFIYSGTKGTGQAVMKMSSGIFRFVSGNIDKKGVALVTPLATIGIRGTDFIVDVAPNEILVLPIVTELFARFALAMAVPFQTPVVMVPKVVIELWPIYAAEISITGVAPPVEVIRFVVPETEVTVPSPVPAPIAVRKAEALNQSTLLSALPLKNVIADGLVEVKIFWPIVVPPKEVRPVDAVKPVAPPSHLFLSV